MALFRRPAEDPYDVAVDLHQQTLYVLVADRQGTELWHGRLPPTEAGLAQLCQHLQPGDRVVLEATTGAHVLANRLDHTGAQILIADPQETRLVGMRGKKTDYRDCRALLRHLRAGELAAIWRPDRETRERRHLCRERVAYNQTIVRLKNRIRALLREEGLTPPAELWSGTGPAWLEHQTLSPASRRLVERELALLQVTLAYKAQHAAELEERAAADVAAQKLLQITGFGPSTALLVLGELGDLQRFPSSKQLVSYAGLNPRVQQSDQRTVRGGISKAGRTQLRWLMVEVAWSHVLHCGPEAHHYHRLVARGKLPQVAIVALARRLLVLVYCLLTRRENYRHLEPERYLRKLGQLAPAPESGRPAQGSRRAWAKQRYEAVTGQAVPSAAEPARKRKAPAGPPSTWTEGGPAAARAPAGHAPVLPKS